MSYVAKGEKEYDAAGAVPPAKIHKIRITLTSSNVASLEKCMLFTMNKNNFIELMYALNSQQRLDQPC